MKESAYNAGNLDLVCGSGRSPGEGNGYPLLYSCLGNPKDREAWLFWLESIRLQKSDMTEGLKLALFSWDNGRAVSRDQPSGWLRFLSTPVVVWSAWTCTVPCLCSPLPCFCSRLIRSCC